MPEITIILPAAPPELYLRGVQWWREAVGFAMSAATLGSSARRPAGTDPVYDLIFHDSPAHVESLAREAIEQGRPEIAPEFRLEVEIVREAMIRGEVFWSALNRMLQYGGPPVDPSIVELRERARGATARALAEAP